MPDLSVYPSQNPSRPHAGQISEMQSRARHAWMNTFTLFTGSAGDGKSLMGAVYIENWWAEVGLPVYSNMDVRSPDGVWRTHDLSLINLSNQTMDNCMVFIDELQNWADKRHWNTNRGKLVQNALMQKRKGNMHFAGTIQDVSWMEQRVLFQVDLHVLCEDLYFRIKSLPNLAPWQKLPGQYIQTRARNISGKRIFGPPYAASGNERVKNHGPLWPIWDLYDSFEKQDVMEPFRKVNMDLMPVSFSDKPQQQIDDTPPQDYEEDEQSTFKRDYWRHHA